jgi:FMN phosphatase YigB (HAD superfamily)
VRRVFLLDVDNTLLDNDALKKRCDRELRAIVGEPATRRFWQIYEEVRAAAGVIDYPATVTRFASETPDADSDAIETAIFEAPFPDYVFPRVDEVIARMWAAGVAVILSDGDAVYQPLKIERSGLAAAVRGNVLVYPHKEDHLDEVMTRFAADRYIQVDDKAPLLAMTKARFGDRVRTVHVRQGHYANDPPDGPPPDLALDRIGDLADLDLVAL